MINERFTPLRLRKPVKSILIERLRKRMLMIAERFTPLRKRKPLIDERCRVRR